MYFFDYQDSDARDKMDTSLRERFATSENHTNETFIRNLDLHFCGKLSFKITETQNWSLFLALSQRRYHKTIWCSKHYFEKTLPFGNLGERKS